MSKTFLRRCAIIAGAHLGTIIAPMHPHNMAWGDDDERMLYLCARTGLYRIRLNIPGIRP
jgi:gluconolactonase